MAILLLGFAVYSQWRFGPAMSRVAGPTTYWPPQGWRAWLGLVMFVVVFLSMAVIVSLRVIFTFIKT
jgi:hypothetical protein